MFTFIHAVFERLKARLVADAGLDFEAQLIARDAERKAVLLRKAMLYDSEGLHTIAKELRQRAEAITFHRPLSSLLPSAPIVIEQHSNGLAPKPPARPVLSRKS